MAIPLCALGDAVLEVIGLNPQGFDYQSEAVVATQTVFDDEIFVQPNAMGERVMRLRLATRPHVLGGLDQYQIIKRHHEARDIVLYLRMTAGVVGEVGGNVIIRRISHREERLAPDGVGRWHEFDVELLYVGGQGGNTGW
ncbi:phage tail protein [Chelatococcus sp.]|uniref:phage tail protein n=1 Tax=Chelatococcus sp. TaxID=1953771 RepID=UPI001ED62397|nr:phage tail protein [Chelatococcus sp.]MBX3545607.1 phage tail protein [Chelatococcus sp.]